MYMCKCRSPQSPGDIYRQSPGTRVAGCSMWVLATQLQRIARGRSALNCRVVSLASPILLFIFSFLKHSLSQDLMLTAQSRLVDQLAT